MAELWYAIVAGLLATYVVVDGYDFGAGMLHLAVSRTDDERRQVFSAIGPFWDGNEVWLLAAGGALFLAFPAVLAAGLSGFYVAIFLVIWCLIGRGVAVEFRSHVDDVMWRGFWDAIFAVTSALLALFFGVALGNIVRGVPLDEQGWFALVLFTDFTSRPPVGILDAYTISVGLFAVAALVAHGAAFLTWRTGGRVSARSRAVAGPALVVVAVAWPLVTWGTAVVRPSFFEAFGSRRLAWGLVALAAAGLGMAAAGVRRQRDGTTWLGTSAFLAGLLAATAVCAFPDLLHSVPEEAYSLTVAGSASPAGSLRSALVWYLPGLVLAIAYQVVVARVHRGKAQAGDYGGH